MEKVNVGFIGAGNLANRMHYPSLAEMEDVNLVAICDLDKRKLDQTANRYGVRKRYTDYKQMLENEKLDAVYIVVPPKALRELALYSLSKGKHVFMEKPPGMSVSETEEMTKIAREHNCKTLVGFNRRYSPVIVKAIQFLLERGTPTLGVVEFHKDLVGKRLPYGISTLVSDIIHSVDLLRGILGEVKEVTSYVDHFFSDWDNCYNALIRFENSAIGIVSANRSSGARYERFEFHAREIAAYIRAPEVAEIYKDNQAKPLILRGEELTGSDDQRITYGYFAENRHFINCIKEDKKPLTDLEDSLKTMRLVEMMEKGESAPRRYDREKGSN